MTNTASPTEKPRSPLAAAPERSGTQLTTSFGPPVNASPMSVGPNTNSGPPTAIALGAAYCSNAGPLPLLTEAALNAASTPRICAASSLASVLGKLRRCLVSGVPNPAGIGVTWGPPALNTNASTCQSPPSARRQEIRKKLGRGAPVPKLMVDEPSPQVKPRVPS